MTFCFTNGSGSAEKWTSVSPWCWGHTWMMELGGYQCYKSDGDGYFRYNLGATSAGAPFPTQVGQCRVTVSKPVLKARLASALRTKTCWTAFKFCVQFKLAPVR